MDDDPHDLQRFVAAQAPVWGDALELHSCLTLFALAAPDEPRFRSGLERFYRGASDPGTLRLLGRG